MPIALAGHRIEIRSPRRLEARAGSEVALEVDIELPEPWLDRPRLGRVVRSVDGEGLSGISVAFECDRATSVPALVSGTARVSDTRIDVHTPPGFPEAGAGRGHEVAIAAPGGFFVAYGHLERGSGKQGPVRAGDRIGASGNTGRCADGCGRSFVLIDISGARNARTLDDLCEPIALELLVDGRHAGTVPVPPGETRIVGLAAGRVRVPRETRSACALELRLVRRRSALATLEAELKVHV